MKSFKLNFAKIKRIVVLTTPPLWTDLVQMFSRKLRHASFLSFQRTDSKNVIFENIHWAHSEDAEGHRGQTTSKSKMTKILNENL